MAAEDVLGRGFAFPLRVGPTGVGESAGVARVEESIRLILGTQHGERVMRPTFGANLKSLVFAPNNATTASLASYYVTQALTAWEPRIDVLEVLVTNDAADDRLDIEIRYRLKATAQQLQLAVQFPLERG